MIDKLKLIGIILTALGIFTAICGTFATVYCSNLDVTTSYKIGMIMGAAIAESCIGLCLNLFGKYLEN